MTDKERQWRKDHRELLNERAREYYKRNREKCCAATAKWRRENPNKVREQKRLFHARHSKEIAVKRKAYFDGRKALKSEYDRLRREREGAKLVAQQLEWRKANKEHLNAYHRMKRANDPQYAIKNNLRCRMNAALRMAGIKRDKPLEVLVGAFIEDVMRHLEAQFKPGMTWENRRQWHIDHIIPCSAFDLTKADDRARCFHFTNLQPMWAVENIRKGGVNRLVKESP
jgi:hypothetical protein